MLAKYLEENGKELPMGFFEKLFGKPAEAESAPAQEMAEEMSFLPEGEGIVLPIDRVEELLDEMAEQFPQELFDELNGGVNLMEQAVPDPEFPEGEMYILGEFCDDLLGRYINLYYGSFAALARQEGGTEEVWREELLITLSHELTHHMESRGGLHALDDRDAEELTQWREEFGKK